MKTWGQVCELRITQIAGPTPFLTPRMILPPTLNFHGYEFSAVANAPPCFDLYLKSGKLVGFV
jgi:hypothetical protein